MVGYRYNSKHFLVQCLFPLVWFVSTTSVVNAQSSSQSSSDTIIPTTSIPTKESNDGDSEGGGEMVLLGKAVLLLAALKLTGVIFLYFVWRKIAPIVMPRRNVDISEGPSLKESSVWDWLEPNSEDTPEVLGSENLRYKGVLYVRVEVDDNENENESDTLPQTEV